MANLLNHEDLKRLKGFIEFVSSNPTILNMPQLDFVKKFIEKFGGKVPAGDFKMPGGGKCPFGGDSSDEEGVKAEPKAAEAEATADEVEMDSDPESEVELDMEADTYQDYNILEQDDQNISNAIFLKENTIKIVRKNRKRRKAEFTNKKCLTPDKEYHVHEHDVTANVEEKIEEEMEQEQDPISLSAVDVIIKKEIDESEDEKNIYELMDKRGDFDYELNSSELEEDDDEIDTDYNDDLCKTSQQRNLKKSRTKTTESPNAKKKIKRQLREPKKIRKTKKNRPIVCVDSCTLKCRENINQNQRRKLRSEFFELNYEEQKNYILQWVEIKCGRKIRVCSKRVPRGFRSRYYLPGHNCERHRVCIKFFMSTLLINNSLLKTTLESSYAQRQLTEQQSNDNTATTNEVSISNNEETNIVTINNSNKEDVVQLIELTKTITELSSEEKKPKEKINYNKVPKKKRVPQPSRCEQISCLMKCTTHFTEEQRSQICTSYWSMDYKRRKDFLVSKTETKPLQTMLAPEYRKTKKAQRAYQNFYYLRGASGNNVRVCLRFFLATLCISRRVIQEAIDNVDKQTGLYVGEDKRRIKKKKISDDMIEEVKRHIESYPTWVPHKSSKTRYLDSSLSILNMYRQYKEKCDLKQLKTVSNAYYYDIFHNHYQLEFLKRTNKHPTRIQPCRRKPRAPDDVRPPKPKKVNTNISEYKGNEPGGYWIPAANTELMTSTNTDSVVQIQENVQLQTAYYANTPYTEQQMQEIAQQQSSTSVTLPIYEYPSYTQNSGFFRML